MAARGAAVKEAITHKILETFPNSFMNGKEIRIPVVEEGEPIEIKVTLTAAKDIVGGSAPQPQPFNSDAPTVEEKAKVAELVHQLGLDNE